MTREEFDYELDSIYDPKKQISVIDSVAIIMREAADILFQNGKYKPLGRWSIIRWVKLGKLMWRLYEMIRNR